MGYLLREFRVVTLGFGPTLHLAQTRDAVRADGVKAAEHWRKNLSSYVGLLNNFHSGYHRHLDCGCCNSSGSFAILGRCTLFRAGRDLLRRDVTESSLWWVAGGNRLDHKHTNVDLSHGPMSLFVTPP